jgi:GcrA cell cycle regulator
VIGKAHRLNLSPRPSPVSRLLTEAAKDEFHRLWSAGKDSNAIAVELGISPGHARQVQFRLKLVRHTAGHIALSAPPARPVVKTAAAPARIEKRPPEGCCWPMWGFRASPTHVYCAAVRPDVAKPYCAEHHQKAFVRINRLAAA